nr:MAG TPA: hypothetical protein [Caudoviricetes sp.]
MGEPVPIRAGPSTYRRRRLARRSGVPGEIVSEGEARTPRDRPRNTAEKSRRVCRHNGLFVAIPTVGENRDGIGLAVDRLRTRTRWRG